MTRRSAAALAAVALALSACGRDGDDAGAREGEAVSGGEASAPDLPSVLSYRFCQVSSSMACCRMSLTLSRSGLSSSARPTPYGSSENGLPTTFSASGSCAA